MSLLAALVCTLLVQVGVRPVTGEPVYLTVCPIEQVLASVEFDRLIRSRNAHALAALRAEAERTEARAVQPTDVGGSPAVPASPATVPAVSVSPTSVGIAPLPPGQIAWRPEVERWRSLVARYFGDDTEHALAIIRCESLGDPDAYNPAGPVSGLFQHRDRYWADRSSRAGWAGWSIFDPETNVAVAAWLVYQGGGWSHWAGAPWGVYGCEEYACDQGVC